MNYAYKSQSKIHLPVTVLGLVILLGAMGISCSPSSYDMVGFYAGLIPSNGGATQSIELQLASNNTYLMKVETYDPVLQSHLYRGMWELRDNVLSLLIDGSKDWRFKIDRSFLLLESLQPEYTQLPADALSIRKISR